MHKQRHIKIPLYKTKAREARSDILFLQNYKILENRKLLIENLKLRERERERVRERESI